MPVTTISTVRIRTADLVWQRRNGKRHWQIWLTHMRKEGERSGSDGRKMEDAAEVMEERKESAAELMEEKKASAAEAMEDKKESAAGVMEEKNESAAEVMEEMKETTADSEEHRQQRLMDSLMGERKNFRWLRWLKSKFYGAVVGYLLFGTEGLGQGLKKTKRK